MNNEVSSVFFLFDSISSQSAKNVIEWIVELNLSEVRPEYATLFICSEGGELSPAFAMIDMMRSSTVPIRTTAMGEVQSAAFMVFIAGEKGGRTIKPNTSLMSHRLSAGSSGKIHDLKSHYEELDTLSEKMINHYIECTSKKRSFIEKNLLTHTDIYLTPFTAVKMGCGDLVM